MPQIENITHILSHRDTDQEYSEPVPAWDYHYDANYMSKVEVLIYKISYPKMVKFYIKHQDIEILALPFEKILEDISSGVWMDFNITIFNLLGKMCKKEFAA